MNEILLWGHLCFLFDSLGGSEAGKIAKNSSGENMFEKLGFCDERHNKWFIVIVQCKSLISACHDNVFVLFACVLNIRCSFIFVHDCKPSAKSVKVCFLCDINNFHTKAANSTQNARKKAKQTIFIRRPSHRHTFSNNKQ